MTHTLTKFVFLLFLCVCVWGQDEILQVSAKNFKSDMKKGITELQGEVVVTKITKLLQFLRYVKKS